MPSLAAIATWLMPSCRRSSRTRWPANRRRGVRLLMAITSGIFCKPDPRNFATLQLRDSVNDERGKGRRSGRRGMPVCETRSHRSEKPVALTIEDLDFRRAAARLGGGVQRIEAQHKKGRLTAR